MRCAPPRPPTLPTPTLPAPPAGAAPRRAALLAGLAALVAPCARAAPEQVFFTTATDAAKAGLKARDEAAGFQCKVGVVVVAVAAAVARALENLSLKTPLSFSISLPRAA